ncbi:hypothetical protein F7Q99_20185 [Streptomyces kaniharaensis]|uniref:Uncharacterized protein n=1 Tax=Streptomyces kaniharaensis TaxID=212423 RepID=A0A6N7KSM3_9ACTN|nr:hypothetical protein [Streptomyces kaniharaensis]MQS14520.1 hypothetical protein [Streptomyces kaniharaensis]
MTNTPANAVTREAAWLTTFGDGLPALLKANGGPWDVIQAYMPRTPAAQKTQLYVLRRRWQTDRLSIGRRLPSYHFHLVAYWPIGATTTGTQIAETEQAAFDNALYLLVQRIEGFATDHSHGGRFLSVAEAPPTTVIDVEYGDPAHAISAGFLTATVTYTADDQDYTA